ncbi:CvpA family protein [Aureimonas frigidaquae]|uniref:Colicin V production protein n=1 Tax=Aureimonas frigidaquae TaxID=424757 RepID=A0A0P0Z341_9HYPH|nr:CvpA family protein [Aureimonas frigidaquae]BAT28298.1 colicin V production protein [Aureimonas frigidaquae]
MTITLLDVALVVITLISAILAMVRGFSREVLSIVSWVVAAAAAWYFFPQLTPFTAQYIDNHTLAMAVTALAIFLVVLIVVSLITMHIADFIIDSRVGAVDRILGFLFGAARGVLLMVVAVVFLNWLNPDQQHPQIADARSKPFLDDLGADLVGSMDGLVQYVNRQLGPPPAVETEAVGAQPAEAPAEPGSVEDAITGAQQPQAN